MKENIISIKPRITADIRNALLEIAARYKSSAAAFVFLQKKFLEGHPRIYKHGKINPDMLRTEFELDMIRRSSDAPKPSMESLRAKFDTDDVKSPGKVCCCECAKRYEGCSCCCHQPVPSGKLIKRHLRKTL